MAGLHFRQPKGCHRIYRQLLRLPRVLPTPINIIWDHPAMLIPLSSGNFSHTLPAEAV